MAKSKLTKWIIGATGVTAFTGFIGVVNQTNGTGQSVAAAANENVQTAAASSESDSVKAQWLASSYDDEENGEHGGYAGVNNTVQNSANYSSNVAQPAQQSSAPKVRSRAS